MSEETLKEEKVGYLKSKLNLLQGKLVLTRSRLVLDAHKTTAGGGILGLILKSRVEKKNYGFDLELKRIKNIEQGKHGLQKNILEVTDDNENTYRILVKDYQEWADMLNQ